MMMIKAMTSPRFMGTHLGVVAVLASVFAISSVMGALAGYLSGSFLEPEPEHAVALTLDSRFVVETVDGVSFITDANTGCVYIVSRISDVVHDVKGCEEKL